MKRITFLCLLASLTVAAGAITPQEETPGGRGAQKALFTKQVKRVLASRSDASDPSYQTFFEGFEDRPEGYGNYYDEWLPQGWQDISKSGQTVPGANEYRHNLTWRVMSDETRNNSPMCENYAYEGECFAFIMPDVAYPGHYDLDVQDEWLISPAFTPKNEDWLYFYLFYSPAWTTYNREDKTFTGRNNELEVYISTDNGENWTCLWNLIDNEIKGNYTDDELRADLIDLHRENFSPIFINLKDFVGVSVQVAFRYFGSTGHGMAIDNVAVGIPQPIAKYTQPNGFFRKGINAQVDYPAQWELLAPADTEANWINKSKNALGYEWTYSDVNGAVATSTDKNLVTPGYSFGTTAQTPLLTAIFESRRSEPFAINFPTMQVGGILTDDGEECGTGYYDAADPEGKVVMSSGFIGFNPELDLNWEMRLGQMDGALDVMGFVNVFPAGSVPYGFDFVDVPMMIREIEPDSNLSLSIFRLDEDGAPAECIGESIISGNDIEADEDNYQNVRFKFAVPVYVDCDIMMVLLDSNRDVDNIALPYIKTTSEQLGNSMVYLWAYDALVGWYDTFYNLNNFALNNGYHFAGLIMTPGTSYSVMNHISGDADIEVPCEGMYHDIVVEATHPHTRWALTENGVEPAEWASCTYDHDAASGQTHVAIKFEPSHVAETTENTLYLVSPGSRIKLNVTRAGDPNSVASFNEDAVKVSLNEGVLTILNAFGTVDVFDMSSRKVASVRADDRCVLDLRHLMNGVYLVRVGSDTFKVLK